MEHLNIVNSGEFGGLKRNNETTSENQTIFDIRGQSKFRKLQYSNHFLAALMKEIYALFCCQLFFVVFPMFFFRAMPSKMIIMVKRLYAWVYVLGASQSSL